MSTTRTAIVVTIVAVLIWVFAEGESLRTSSIGSRISIEAPAGMALRVIDPEGYTGSIMLNCRGSTAAIDSIRSALDRPIKLDRTNGVPRTPGEHQIDLMDALRSAEPIADSGVSIVEVEPESVRVDLVTLDSITLPVRAVVDGEVEGVPTVSPNTITIAAPSALAAQLPQGATVTARVRQDQLRRLPLGVERTVTGVQLELPELLVGAWGVGEPSDATASVTMTLRDTTSSAVIPQVPVQLVLATTEQGRWDIEIDDPLIENVTVRGASDLVDAVTGANGASRTRVLAYLPLSFEELEQGITSKDVEFVVRPASAGVLEFEAEDITVGITIRPRQTETDEAPAP